MSRKERRREKREREREGERGNKMISISEVVGYLLVSVTTKSYMLYTYYT